MLNWNHVLILLVVFFAMNMGASGIAPSFSAVFGGSLIKKTTALLLFTVFVVYYYVVWIIG